jgi:hypothetical protein
MKSRGTILLSGAVANKAGHGGETWVRMNWALGLRRLGWRVIFVEQTAVGSGSEYFQGVMERFKFADSAALLDDRGQSVFGLTVARLLDLAGDAEALINISGHLSYRPILDRAKRCVYVDIDPGFTQFWHAEGNVGARLAHHDFFFTIGENIGSPNCPIPTGGIAWRKTRPPVCLEAWPVLEQRPFDRFTTIASWRGPFGVLDFAGQTFGLKVHEFRKFLELPERTGLPFELALNIHPADHKDFDALQRHGWHVTDPQAAAGTPDAFQRYIQQSSAEFSVAQGIYVQTGSGWFSDRTAAYLASGKPALVQDTGFSRHLPTGEGLVAFRTPDDAIAGAESIASKYQSHCHAAGEIAEEYFDSDKVIGQLLADIGLK